MPSLAWLSAWSYFSPSDKLRPRLICLLKIPNWVFQLLRVKWRGVKGPQLIRASLMDISVLKRKISETPERLRAKGTTANSKNNIPCLLELESRLWRKRRPICRIGLEQITSVATWQCYENCDSCLQIVARSRKTFSFQSSTHSIQGQHKNCGMV